MRPCTMARGARRSKFAMPRRQGRDALVPLGMEPSKLLVTHRSALCLRASQRSSTTAIASWAEDSYNRARLTKHERSAYKGFGLVSSGLGGLLDPAGY